MQKKVYVLLIVLIICVISSAYAEEVSFTQEDRERLVRLEVEVKGLQRQIDDLKTFMLWGFGILFGGMGILIGFVIWDRRTAITPVTKITKEIEEKEERVEKILREYARKEPRLAEILKEVGGL